MRYSLVKPLVLSTAAAVLMGCGQEVPPLPDIVASVEERVLERGQYLVYGPAGCARCHTDRSQLQRLQAGEELPLTGGRHWELAIGDIYGANLTGDKSSGLGEWTDGEIARAIRYGVDKHGNVMAPMMEYADISDADLQAIVSFLRSLEPISNAIPENTFTIVGRIAKAFALKPQMPSGKEYPAKGVTREYGAYLANVLSACVACHTERDQSSGQLVGELLAGGTRFPYEPDLSKVVVPPNITPDKETGRIAGLTEEQFVQRMRAGPSVQMTHMPWGAFKRTDDADLRAIYRYLMSVPAVSKDTGPALQSAAVQH